MLSEAARRYWEEFVTAIGVNAAPTCTLEFGDGPEMADELLALVLAGPKRAMAGRLRCFDEHGPVPRPEPLLHPWLRRVPTRCIL